MKQQRTPLPHRLAAIVAVAGLGLAACGSDDTSTDDTSTGGTAAAEAGAEISIHDPWSRQPATGQDRTAVYGMVTNNTDEAITAVAATTSVTERVELHQTSMNDDGQMSMSEMDGGFEIGVGETFAFEPGGPHVMLFDIDPDTYPENVAVTLEFDNGATLDFSAEVRAIGADMDMADDGEMDGEMEMDDSDE